MTETQQAQEAPVLTITQFTNAIKHCLESTFPQAWLQGEISNCKAHTSGHIYFSLKDENAQISAVMFRGDAVQLRSPFKDGDHVIVRGEISVYPQRGNYQLVVRELKQAGLGILQQKLEELKLKLHKLGWFHSSRKKPLPKLPQRVGIVTSPTGAAIQDILKVLGRRFSGLHIILNPVKVQGDGAAQEIAQAIRQFNEHNMVDVLIVGRGGGSFEDLWAFNEEVVAEAIYHSKIPIISAVGHEIDHCIADYVADVRAPTPSAAAEIVIGEKAHLIQHLDQMLRRIQQTILHLIRHDRKRLEGITRQPFFLSPYAILGPSMQRLDDMRMELDQSMKQAIILKKMLIEGRSKNLHSLKPTTKISHFRQKLNYWERQLDSQWQQSFNLRKERLKSLKTMLHGVDPKNVLTKGYCILFSEKDGSVITSIQAVKKQQDVKLVLSDGELIATIKDIIPK